MSEDDDEEFEEYDKDGQIQLILDELKKFQGILDEEDVEISLTVLRKWAGHINFSLTVLIEEFSHVREKIEAVICDKVENVKDKDKDKDFYM